MIRSDVLGYFYTHLSQLERDQISILRAGDISFREIGEILGRSGSSISREFRRNKVLDEDYLPSKAHSLAVDRKSDSALKISKCAAYEYQIHHLLGIGWTPEQIAGRLTKDKPNFSVSYETIYCYIYRYHMDWAKLLPRKHEPRWHKGMGKKHTKRDMIPNRTCILERPSEIDDKSVFGHWEGDSIVCSQSVASLNVIVERQTQFVNITLVENRGPEVTKNAMIERLGQYKKRSRKSLTMDNGIEFKYHEVLKKKLKVDTYFCQPYHSWEKGLVEQVNGLIRRFLPKKTDLSKVTKKEIKLIEYLLNSRPRKLLDWSTPAEVFAKKSRMKVVNDALAA